MFLRKNWLPLSVFIVAIVAVGLYLLTTQTPKDPIINKTTEVEKPQAEAPVGDTSQGGHFHEDGTWHAGPHETPRADKGQIRSPSQLPNAASEVGSAVVPPRPPTPSEVYQALREKYPDQTQNPPPFEDVPVDLWDFEATKKAFMDHFNFYVEHYDPKEGWSHTRELRIAAAIMANIDNAAKPWFGLFTPEQCEEINALRQLYFDFKGVEVNHERVSELVRDEGYSVSEALDISREEGATDEKQ